MGNINHTHGKIPLYVVCGFLNTGKTTFINRLVRTDAPSVSVAIISFEKGLTTFTHPTLFLEPPPNELTPVIIEKYRNKIDRYLIQNPRPSAIWIEWNGMTTLSSLDIFLQATDLAPLVKLKNIYYVTNTDYTLHMLGRTGEANLNHLSQADYIIWEDPLSTADSANQVKAQDLLRSYRPDCPIFSGRTAQIEAPRIVKTPRVASYDTYLTTGLSVLVALYLLCLVFFPAGIPPTLHRILLITSGIMLQTLPFLALGIALSTLLRYLVTTTQIDNLLAGSTIKSYTIALCAGIFFPICDCTTIPIFRGLLQRQIKLPVALTFLLASPFVNPISLFATYYAFDNSLTMVLYRVSLGLIAALSTALTFTHYRGLNYLQTNNSAAISAFQFQQSLKFGFTDGHPRQRWQYLLQHSKSELFVMGQFLLFGSILSGIFQMTVLPWLKGEITDTSTVILIPIFMGIAFCLSLCATSDAMIARAMTQNLPLQTTLGFLVFGPMIDLKNVFLLKAFFPTRFVLRLSITAAGITSLLLVGSLFIL